MIFKRRDISVPQAAATPPEAVRAEDPAPDMELTSGKSIEGYILAVRGDDTLEKAIRRVTHNPRTFDLQLIHRLLGGHAIAQDRVEAALANGAVPDAAERQAITAQLTGWRSDTTQLQGRFPTHL
jgi:hypothetical protein